MRVCVCAVCCGKQDLLLTAASGLGVSADCQLNWLRCEINWIFTHFIFCFNYRPNTQVNRTRPTTLTNTQLNFENVSMCYDTAALIEHLVGLSILLIALVSKWTLSSVH